MGRPLSEVNDDAVLGVIVAPGQAAQLGRQVMAEGLPDLIAQRLSSAAWQVAGRLVETGWSIRRPATRRHRRGKAVVLHRDWDLVLCLTELPVPSRFTAAGQPVSP